MVVEGMCNVLNIVNVIESVMCVVVISFCVVIYIDVVDCVVVSGGVLIEVVWNEIFFLVY